MVTLAHLRDLWHRFVEEHGQPPVALILTSEDAKTLSRMRNNLGDDLCFPETVPVSFRWAEIIVDVAVTESYFR